MNTLTTVSPTATATPKLIIGRQTGHLQRAMSDSPPVDHLRGLDYGLDDGLDDATGTER